MSLLLLMDRAIFDAVARGAEPECFLVGADAMRRMEKEADDRMTTRARSRGHGRVTDDAARFVNRHATFRDVPILSSRNAKADTIELILRPYLGETEVRRVV